MPYGSIGPILLTCLFIAREIHSRRPTPMPQWSMNPDRHLRRRFVAFARVPISCAHLPRAYLILRVRSLLARRIIIRRTDAYYESNGTPCRSTYDATPPDTARKSCTALPSRRTTSPGPRDLYERHPVQTPRAPQCAEPAYRSAPPPRNPTTLSARYYRKS